jgi:PadR family transcriptional regulator
MKLLTRSEEMLLLAVWRLQQEAYGVTIRDQLQTVTGRSWSFGALFVSLDRLVRKGFLESYMSDPLPVRGGRSRRMYRLRPTGREALCAIREVEDALWSGISVKGLRYQL